MNARKNNDIKNHIVKALAFLLEKSKSPADAANLDEKKKLLSEIKSLTERGH